MRGNQTSACLVLHPAHNNRKMEAKYWIWKDFYVHWGGKDQLTSMNAGADRFIQQWIESTKLFYNPVINIWTNSIVTSSVFVWKYVCVFEASLCMKSHGLHPDSEDPTGHFQMDWFPVHVKKPFPNCSSGRLCAVLFTSAFVTLFWCFVFDLLWICS